MRPIIDMHLHALTAGISDQGRPLPRYRMPGPPVDDEETPTTDEGLILGTLDQMDRHGIVKGFLSGKLDVLYQWVAYAPDRFIPSPHFSVVVDTPSVELLRREYEAGRLKAMGEISSQYRGLAPTDPRLEPYFALAEELDLPVLIHSLGLAGPSQEFRASLGRPLLLEDVLARHPNLRLWIENAGFPFFDDMFCLMYRYPQVYADVSTITWIIPRAAFYDHLKRLLNAELGNRLMFGSDQMIWPQTIRNGCRIHRVR